jgi:hypothetical protein
MTRPSKAVTIPRKLDAADNGLFFGLLKREGIPLPVTEFRFAPPRRWRMDFCWRAQFVGLEVDGATWVGGRHTRGSGWAKDTEKLNAAAVAGYRMLRCTPRQLHDLQFIATIRKALFP